VNTECENVCIAEQATLILEEKKLLVHSQTLENTIRGKDRFRTLLHPNNSYTNCSDNVLRELRACSFYIIQRSEYPS